MIINGDCIEEIKKLKSNSIDLILTDPPYLISKESNFHLSTQNTTDELKQRFGKISLDYGDWDKQELDLDTLLSEYYRVLKKGGTLIIFYDIWKSNEIKKYAEKYRFKQPRVCCWLKNNPVPINHKSNYLSNSAEYFFTFIKRGKPTFNSEYDNGIYMYPLCHGKERLDHPTQKPLGLINDLIIKHTNTGDIVLDTFAGTGTTAHAAILNNRKYIMIENSEKYYNLMIDRLSNLKQN